jgi:hypothetical protein
MPCSYSAVADGELFYRSAIGHMAMVRAEVSWRAVAPLLGWRHTKRTSLECLHLASIDQQITLNLLP